MKIFLKFLLSLMFGFSFNVYASDSNDDLTDNISYYRWKNPPQVVINTSYLEGYDRDVIVIFEANKRGKITNTAIIKSSGIEYVDKQCEKAVKKASIYPYQKDGVYYPSRSTQPFRIEVSRKPIFEFFPEIKVKKEDLKGQIRYLSIYSEADDNGNITVAKIRKSTGLQELDNLVLDEFRKKAKFFPLIINGKPYPISDTTNLTLTKFFTLHY